jgi:resuscitation-promoting factor RpfA
VSVLRPRATARHAKPSVVAPVLAAGGLTTTLVVADAALLAGGAAAAAEPSAANFDRLAQCESGGRWNINTGNGYYGGLQFSAATWRSVGYGGLPHQHSREVQIQAGQKLQARSGWGQWPACARKLGLHGGGGARTAAAPAPAPAAKAKASRTRSSAASSTQVPFRGTVTTAASGTVREDVRAWQARMRQRGWKITVDGRFGPQSASVAKRFAAEKGIAVPAGTLNSAAFTAAWSYRIT